MPRAIRLAFGRRAGIGLGRTAMPGVGPTAVLAACLVAVASAPAEAAVLVADPAAADGAPGSLRERVGAAAATGDTVQLPPGTYRLTLGELGIVNKTVTVEGQGQRADQVVITAEGRSRVVLASPGAGSNVTLRRLQVSGGRVAGGTGGGVLKQGLGSLRLEDVTLSGNSARDSLGGGGLAIVAGNVTVLRSAVIGNAATVSAANSGGGGILQTGTAGALTLENVSLAQNTTTVAGGAADAGGSGLLKTTGTLALNFVTVAYNTTSPAGLGALRSVGTQPTVRNTIVAGNGGNCVGDFNSTGFNMADDGAAGCDLDGPGDRPGVFPNVQQPADNGGPTPTLRLPPNTPAINAGDCDAGIPQDQRGVRRPAENETLCDVGAVEFEGWAKVEVPPCSRSGVLPFNVFSPPQTQVEALNYTIDGGDLLNPLRVLLPGGGASASGTLEIPEGRRQLEYWADSFPTGIDRGVQLKHATPLVVVDRTDPRVAVANPNEFATFVIRRRTRVDVTATDSISGLAADPSGSATLDTSARGARTFLPRAVDMCANAAMAPFPYRVLAPGLGVRTVLERVRGRVRTRTAASRAARASQKGQRFASVRAPREVAVRSLVDALRGTVRLTTARDRRTAIQDGEFTGGVFQVRQSGKGSARGLTELRLKGSSFKGCRTAPRRGPRGVAGARGAAGARARAAAKRRVIRRLRGRTTGRFRTRGRFSAATVRGTTWTVEDRCDGTLTRVARGTVAVRDFSRRKTVTVRAGRSYLARAPGRD